jgi:hypothetical protein
MTPKSYRLLGPLPMNLLTPWTLVLGVVRFGDYSSGSILLLGLLP